MSLCSSPARSVTGSMLSMSTSSTTSLSSTPRQITPLATPREYTETLEKHYEASEKTPAIAVDLINRAIGVFKKTLFSLLIESAAELPFRNDLDKYFALIKLESIESIDCFDRLHADIETLCLVIGSLETFIFEQLRRLRREKVDDLEFEQDEELTALEHEHSKYVQSITTERCEVVLAISERITLQNRLGLRIDRIVSNADRNLRKAMVSAEAAESLRRELLDLKQRDESLIRSVSQANKNHKIETSEVRERWSIRIAHAKSTYRRKSDFYKVLCDQMRDSLGELSDFIDSRLDEVTQ